MYISNIKKSIYITSEILKTNSIFKFNKKIDKILLLYTIIGLNTGIVKDINISGNYIGQKTRQL